MSKKHSHFSGLQVENPDLGLPRQPVPLRLVPSITSWSIRTMVSLLASNGEYWKPLGAYEYRRNSPPRQLGIFHFQKLEKGIDDGSPSDIGIFEPNQFVWSDELAEVFWWFLDNVVGDNSMRPHELLIIWDAAWLKDGDLIEESPDFFELLPASLQQANKRRRQKAETAERYERWHHESKRLEAQGHSRARAADLMVGKPISEGASAEAIRRGVREYRKKLGISQ